MGAVKEWALRQWERGYSDIDGEICAKCVNGPALADWVRNNASAKRCSFCKRRSKKPIAASFNDFVGVVLSGIHFLWNHPDDEGIMYVSAEGGYQASITDTSDVIWDLDISDNDDVIAAVIGSIYNDGWVEREYYRGSESDILSWGWDRFQEVVKHETRYFFRTPENDADDHFGGEITPSAMLDAIAEVIVTRLAEFNLIKVISTDSDLIRVRVDRGKRHKTAAALGSPPAIFASQSNRMSPAGVPMFYGAYDYKTARAETVEPDMGTGLTISVGTFRPVRELRVLDLAGLPDIPSIYDEDNRHLIHSLWFLHSFARDISKQITRDGREHIEYVPTQIVTEFFRRVFLIDGKRIDGISYQSSKPNGKVAFVLFCDNNQCIDDEPDRFAEPLLKLVSVRFRK